LDDQNKDQRDRLIALGCVSLLLIIVYGPAAGWLNSRVSTAPTNPSPSSGVAKWRCDAIAFNTPDVCRGSASGT